VLWGIIGYKQLEEDWIGVFKYYTNLSLLFQAIFYSFYLLVFFENPCDRTLETILLVGISFILTSQVVVVFILVLGVILESPELIVDQMKTGGGQFDDGIVLFFERVYHVFPMTFSLIFIPTAWEDITDCAIMTFGDCVITNESIKPTEIRRSETNHLIRSILEKAGLNVFDVHIEKMTIYCYVFFEFCLSCTPFLLYMLVIDLHKQYDLSRDWSIWQPVVGVLVVCGFSIGILTSFLFCSTIPMRWLCVKDIARIKERYGRYNISSSTKKIQRPISKMKMDFRPT
jgi:hypothetical protein